MASNFDIGDIVLVSCWFEVNSAYVNPGVVEARVKDPAGTVTSYLIADPELTQIDTGKFQLAITPDLSGEWWVRWIGTAPAQGEQEAVFYVRAKNVN